MNKQRMALGTLVFVVVASVAAVTLWTLAHRRPADPTRLLSRTETFIDLTQKAADLAATGQTQKALGLYQQIKTDYSDLDPIGYLTVAIDDCRKKKDQKATTTQIAQVSPATQPTTQPAPAKALNLDTVEITYVHPIGKTRIHRSTMKMLRTDNMNDTETTLIWGVSTRETHYTCHKINPDGTGVYEVSMPLQEEKSFTGNSFHISKYEMGKPAQVREPSIAGLSPFNPKLQPTLAETRANVKFSMIVVPDGTPVKVEGYQAAFEKLLTPTLKTIGPLSKMDEQQLAAARENATDGSMLQQMKAARFTYLKFPNLKVLHLGDTWTPDKSSQLTYRLVAFELFRGRPCAKIQIHAPASTSREIKSEAENINQNSEINGLLYLDYQKGEILLAEQTYSFNFGQTVTHQSTSIHVKQTGIIFSREELIER